MEREEPSRFPAELNGHWGFPPHRGFSHGATRYYKHRHREELNIRFHGSLPQRVKVRGRARVRALILALLCVLAGATLAAKDNPPVQYKIAIPAPPDFTALDWLRGQWTGKTGPSGPSGDVQLTVSPDLANHFLVFRGAVKGARWRV